MCSKPLLCVLGDRRCTGDPAAKPGKFVECELDDKGCGRWSSSIQACGSEETCKGGECLPTTCQSPVCGAGTTRCSGDQAFQTCGRDAKGCIVWLPQEPCSGRCDVATGRCSSCTPQTEVCDGQDNNCDGKIDEGFSDLGQACEVGQGECKKTGKKVCSPDKTTTICDATALSPSAEICDGKDNDCNGQIDDKATCPNGQPCLNGFCGKPEPGCADGTRELFTDMAKWPTIAGCAGFYRGESLRAGRSSSSCGSSEQNACAAAEDLCASGWHVCTKSGDPKDLSTRVTDKDCATAGTGLFVAASSHCQSHQPACNYGAGGLLPCTQGGPCSEPLCCGKGCDYGLCKDALWSSETRCARPQSFIGCANANSFHGTPRIDGVLCCKD